MECLLNTRASLSKDSDSDGDAPSDEDAPRDAPRDALRGYLRHLDFELDSASLSPAFGSEEAALTALRNVGEILHRVAIHESEQLSYVRSHMAQFLAMLDAQPSQDIGALSGSLSCSSRSEKALLFFV